MACVDPKKKDSFAVNPEEEFICGDGLPLVK